MTSQRGASPQAPATTPPRQKRTAGASPALAPRLESPLSLLPRASALGLRAKDFLANNDGYTFFSELGDLVVTGPTLTNVNDFRAILVR